MKFFLAFLLIASCQAFSIESAIEKEAFEILVNKATEELEKLALQEFENALLADGKEMSPFEHELITKFANYFGSALREEVQDIVEQVLDSTKAKTAFTKRMYENLRQAALNISQGLHMAPKAAAKFLHDMISDIEAMERSGTFILDIEDMFKNVLHRVSSMMAYELTEKRDISDIWNKINDTLLNIIGRLHGKFHDLHDFLKTIVKAAGDRIRPHVENIKTLAKDFISHVNTVSAKVAQQALEFFKPFASQLGSTWIQLVKKVHERLQQITDHVNATPAY